MMNEKAMSVNAAIGETTDEPPHRYTAALANVIEERWQGRWDHEQTFRALNPGDAGFDPAQPKFFCMDMFPYPSGAGLHVGHPLGYIATDIVCRYKRMNGFNVLHPMGWDAFGLPAEQYAIQTGVHPAITTRKAIDNFRRQLKRFGFSYDWSREFATIDPEYYRWTQWIWLQAYGAWYDPQADKARPIDTLTEAMNQRRADLLEKLDTMFPGKSWSALSAAEQRQFVDDHRLAYLGQQTVNWCPKLGTVLANEEVIDGKSERGGFPVYRKPLKQWMFRITAYADRLLADLDRVKWPDSTRTMQQEWIGRSEGAEVRFNVVGRMESISVFTTRPDTLFGATFLVVAPEHAVVDAILRDPNPETNIASVRDYVDAARQRSDVDRQTSAKDKTGVFTGAYAINPATGTPIPIWVADYVLIGYGHGAIMAVPGHDERDFEFATQFNLPIRDVVHTPALGAIAAFCKRFDAATTTERGDEEQSRTLLEDFVGLAINQDRTDYDAIWEAVSTRRRTAGAGGELGNLRGMISGIWRDAFEGLIKEDFEKFLTIAREKRLVTMVGNAITDEGVAANSSSDMLSIDGLPTSDAKEKVIAWLEQSGHGKRRVNYKLRDWLFSRQRYWGEPFPIVFDEAGNHYPVQESALPVLLPDLSDYTPTESDDPQPLLAKATNWVETTAGQAGVKADLLPANTKVRRETNTMPGWAGSCWYELRYCDPHNASRFVGKDAERYWMVSAKDVPAGSSSQTWQDGIHHTGGVDLYIGGAEHAVLHLLYARFWHKMLFDFGHVSTPEPFGRLFHQGLLTSFAYQRDDKSLIAIDLVEERDEGNFIEISTGKPVKQIITKMSKSLKNVINPDDVIANYGADTFRLYEMYMGPLEASKPWNTRDIVGLHRFLQRAWRLAVDEQTGKLRLAAKADPAIERELARTIHKVAGDIERLAFNTAIAAMISLVNAATSSTTGMLTRDQLERFTLTLSPFAPHIAEELWSKLGHSESIARAPWPTIDESLLVESEIELPVQIMGKVKAKVRVPADADAEAIEQITMASEKVQAQLEGKTIKKIVVVPGKIVNVVAE